MKGERQKEVINTQKYTKGQDKGKMENTYCGIRRSISLLHFQVFPAHRSDKSSV
jgi:hypothetical protein